MNEIDDNLRKDLIDSKNVSQTSSPIKSPRKTCSSKISSFSQSNSNIFSKILKISSVIDHQTLYEKASAFGKISFFGSHYLNKS